MARSRSRGLRAPAALPKAPTGIRGLDELTGGGLPRGRPTLVCGSAGSGKTLFGLEFLVRGAIEFDEPGVAITFEETGLDLAKNVASLGFDLPALERQKRLLVDYVHIERAEIEETGEYNLDGLFVRLQHAVATVKAKRVLLDTVESLFAGLANQNVLRAELRRLFRWLKDRGLTAVVTGERGVEGMLTRFGLEEYISDCVILLDHRVHEQSSTRRLRVVKYRGSTHGTNEYPFLIDEHGFSVLPITSLGLDYEVSRERISTGVAGLDEMLGARGYYRGSCILVSGAAGTGKTSLAAGLAGSAAARRERVLYFSFEESASQLVRNMRSIGLDLRPALDAGHLRIHATRPSAYGLEMHLVATHKAIEQLRPRVIVVDPVTDLIDAGGAIEVHAVLARLIDYVKGQGVTMLMTSLTPGTGVADDSQVGISSLIDTWIVLRNFETAGERNRGISVLKSRGMPHSNRVREFILSSKGITMVDAYCGAAGLLTGTARELQLRRDREEVARLRVAVARKRHVKAAQIEALEAEIAKDEVELGRLARDGGAARAGRNGRKGP
jgi:circadian clock protein KaiC